MLDDSTRRSSRRRAARERFPFWAACCPQREYLLPRMELLEPRLMLDGGAAQLLRDVETRSPSSSPSEIVQAGSTIFLTAKDDVYGRELYVTDGIAAPRLLKDIAPGIGSSSPEHLTPFGNGILFSADDGVHGRELWKSDGTAEGTVLLADLFPGETDHGDGVTTTNASSPYQFIALGSKVYFIADTEETGRELYRADNSGASLLRDIYPGSGGSNPSDFVYYPEHLSDEVDGQSSLVPAKIFFAASNEANGRELWTISENGNVSLFKNLFHERPLEDPNSSNPRGMILYHGHVYFAAQGGEYNSEGDLETVGHELWRTDGTLDGTKLLADIAPGFGTFAPFSSSPHDFVHHGNSLYFAAYEVSVGNELFRITDTDDPPTLVKNIRGGQLGSNPSDLISTDGYLYFVADGGSGRELWRSNGTAFGTQQVRDIRPGSIGSDPEQLTKFGDRLLFTADDNTGVGRELYITDGTLEGTVNVVDLHPGRVDSRPSWLNVIDGYVYFAASTPLNGIELWKTDGTAVGTRMLDAETTTTQGSSPRELTRVGTSLFFTTRDGSLWTSDGTLEDTRRVGDLRADVMLGIDDRLFFSNAGSLYVLNGTSAGPTLLTSGQTETQELVAAGGKLFYVAATGSGGKEVWTSDGTVQGTRMVLDIAEGANSSFPRVLTPAGDLVFFTAGDNASLWRTDGTEQGTIRLTDLQSNAASYPFDLFALGNTLFFTAGDGARDLWVTDGSVENTLVVAHNSDFGGREPLNPIGALDGNLLFHTFDPETRADQLWKSDGTLEGTLLIKDVPEYCQNEQDGRNTVAFQNRIVFWADDPEHGCELWTTDGTTEGTTLWMDLNPGPLSTDPSFLRVVGDKLFFAGNTTGVDEFGDPTYLGRELYVSDGTLAGTFVHTQINTLGVRHSNPSKLTEISGTLYFVADDGIHGEEIWTTNLRLKANDTLFEILAKDIAYSQWLEGSTISLSTNYGLPHVFEVTNLQDPDSGFDAFGLLAANINPILIVRGTNFNFLNDWFTNADPRGVGYGQFLANQDRIFDWLDMANATGYPVSITGHSLGGAVTQLIAAHYTHQQKPLDQVVTFNSPGISTDYGVLFDPLRVASVMHYVTNGDLVSMAGDMFLPGQWARADFYDLNPLNHHLLPVVADQTHVMGQADVIRHKPDDTVLTPYDTTDWLSSPFYFHTDYEYFLWLALAQVAVNTVTENPLARQVPKLMLFRSTTEAGRELIGSVWHGLNDVVNLIDNLIDCDSEAARVELPDIDINFFNLLQVEASGLAISCVPGQQPVLRMQGQVVLPEIFEATADLAGEHFIQLGDDGFDINGVFSISDVPIVPGYFNLEQFTIGINTLENTLNTSGKLEIVPWDVKVSASLGFDENQLNFVHVEVDGLDLPLTFILPGAILQRLAGEVNHIAEADPLPISFGGGIGMTLGKQITLNLPSWAGGTLAAKLLALDVDGNFDRRHLTAEGTIDIVGSLARAEGALEVNWDQGFVSVVGGFDVLGIIQSTDSRFRADSGLNVTLQAAATFGVPDAIPLIGGTQGLTGNVFFEFTNDDDFSNDSAAAWTDFNIPFIGATTLGFRVWLNGSVGLVGASEVAEFTSGGSGEQDASAQFEFTGSEPWALFAAEWDNAATATLRLVLPDGTLLDEADFALRDDIAIVPELSTPTRRVVVVRNPEAGIWTFAAASSQELGAIRLQPFVPSELPTLSLDSVSGGADRAPVTIDYTATDPDSDALVTFYYDTDDHDFDGLRIGSVQEQDQSAQFQWDTAGVRPGDYFVYAVIDDGVNPPKSVYAGSPVTITAPGLGGVVWYDANGDGIQDVGESGMVDVAVFLDTDGNGSWDATEPLTASRADDPLTAGVDESGQYAFHDLSPGDYRVNVIPKFGFVPSTPADGQLVTTIAANAFRDGNDFGLRVKPASIQGVVWRDGNRNGFRDAYEKLLGGVEVHLLDATSKQLLDTMKTDSNGAYAFTSLPPGDYQIELVPLHAHVATAHFVPGKDAFDSDFDSSTQYSLVLSAGVGGLISHIDAGLFDPWQSYLDPRDVNADHFITPSDVLFLVNDINGKGSRPLPFPPVGTNPPPYLDVHPDGFISPLDVLLIVNYLNSRADGEGERRVEQPQSQPLKPDMLEPLSALPWLEPNNSKERFASRSDVQHSDSGWLERTFATRAAKHVVAFDAWFATLELSFREGRRETKPSSIGSELELQSFDEIAELLWRQDLRVADNGMV